MSRPESVSSRIATLGFEQLELGDLVALLLAAGEALVDGALGERRVEVELLHGGVDVLDPGAQLRRLAVDGGLGGAQEVGHRDAGHLDGVLHRQEQPGAGALVDASSRARPRRRGSRCRR